MNNEQRMLVSLLPEGADGALIISSENKRYFCSFPSEDGFLLITRERSYLLVDFRYTEDAAAKSDGCEVVAFESLMESLGGIIDRDGLHKIMLECSAFTISVARPIEKLLALYGAEADTTGELDKVIEKLRIVKTTAEVEKIMKAQRITEQALSETLPYVKEGVTERELELELEYRMKKLGAEDVSFDLIVITGAKTSMPHGVPGDNKVRPGDFITFDIGALYEGYHSDMTRTYAYGQITEKQKRVYEVVKTAQQLGLDAVRSGVRCCDVDAAARTYIYHAGFEGCFGHSTGHGVGLEIHEAPAVSAKNEGTLQSGMVITVEPGIYLPGEFGVRIEDTVVVTPEGCVDLAVLPKELIVL